MQTTILQNVFLALISALAVVLLLIFRKKIIVRTKNKKIFGVSYSNFYVLIVFILLNFVLLIGFYYLIKLIMFLISL